MSQVEAVDRASGFAVETLCFDVKIPRHQIQTIGMTPDRPHARQVTG